jgi:hypothetical protein
MKWEYMIEELELNKSYPDLEKELDEMGDNEWEAVTSWTVPGDSHTNKGQWIVRILFKKPK